METDTSIPADNDSPALQSGDEEPAADQGETLAVLTPDPDTVTQESETDVETLGMEAKEAGKAISEVEESITLHDASGPSLSPDEVAVQPEQTGTFDSKVEEYRETSSESLQKATTSPLAGDEQQDATKEAQDFILAEAHPEEAELLDPESELEQKPGAEPTQGSLPIGEIPAQHEATHAGAEDKPAMLGLLPALPTTVGASHEPKILDTDFENVLQAPREVETVDRELQQSVTSKPRPNERDLTSVDLPTQAAEIPAVDVESEEIGGEAAKESSEINDDSAADLEQESVASRSPLPEQPPGHVETLDAQEDVAPSQLEELDLSVSPKAASEKADGEIGQQSDVTPEPKRLVVSPEPESPNSEPSEDGSREAIETSEYVKTEPSTIVSMPAHAATEAQESPTSPGSSESFTQAAAEDDIEPKALAVGQPNESTNPYRAASPDPVVKNVRPGDAQEPGILLHESSADPLEATSSEVGIVETAVARETPALGPQTSETQARAYESPDAASGAVVADTEAVTQAAGPPIAVQSPLPKPSDASVLSESSAHEELEDGTTANAQLAPTDGSSLGADDVLRREMDEPDATHEETLLEGSAERSTAVVPEEASDADELASDSEAPSPVVQDLYAGAPGDEREVPKPGKLLDEEPIASAAEVGSLELDPSSAASEPSSPTLKAQEVHGGSQSSNEIPSLPLELPEPDTESSAEQEASGFSDRVAPEVEDSCVSAPASPKSAAEDVQEKASPAGQPPSPLPRSDLPALVPETSPLKPVITTDDRGLSDDDDVSRPSSPESAIKTVQGKRSPQGEPAMIESLLDPTTAEDKLDTLETPSKEAVVKKPDVAAEGSAADSDGPETEQQPVKLANLPAPQEPNEDFDIDSESEIEQGETGPQLPASSPQAFAQTADTDSDSDSPDANSGPRHTEPITTTVAPAISPIDAQPPAEGFRDEPAMATDHVLRGTLSESDDSDDESEYVVLKPSDVAPDGYQDSVVDIGKPSAGFVETTDESKAPEPMLTEGESEDDMPISEQKPLAGHEEKPTSQNLASTVSSVPADESTIKSIENVAVASDEESYIGPSHKPEAPQKLGSDASDSEISENDEPMPDAAAVEVARQESRSLPSVESLQDQRDHGTLSGVKVLDTDGTDALEPAKATEAKLPANQEPEPTAEHELESAQSESPKSAKAVHIPARDKGKAIEITPENPQKPSSLCSPRDQGRTKLYAPISR
ncbi:hypothetical protein NM208_g14759 [Fusarium decemcellulare]|uniref:Uncharacterized protein n=1 Tax=Fusarium decemcellulare TaxID=57161 RepID=A0ACC1RID6_9HYPO|nr:hypothetical protein NM208_g14759 [Fusarium decemcellulare]